MLVDTHCHLDFPEFDQDRDEVIRRAKCQGVDYIINIGASLEGSRSSVELAQKYASIVQIWSFSFSLSNVPATLALAGFPPFL